MQERDRISSQAEMLQMISSTEGLKVIMSELKLRIASGDRSVDIGDPVWAQRVAHRDGKIEGLREMLKWLEGRLTYIQDSEPPPEA